MPKNIVKTPHFLHPSIDTEHWPIEAAADVISGRFPFRGTVEGLSQRNEHEPVGCWFHVSIHEQDLLSRIMGHTLRSGGKGVDCMYDTLSDYSGRREYANQSYLSPA